MKTRGANENRYVSAVANNQVPINANQNDLLAAKNLIRGDQRHLQAIFKTGKLYGPMSPEAQVKAIEYAYGIKTITKKKLIE